MAVVKQGPTLRNEESNGDQEMAGQGSSKTGWERPTTLTFARNRGKADRRFRVVTGGFNC